MLPVRRVVPALALGLLVAGCAHKSMTAVATPPPAPPAHAMANATPAPAPTPVAPAAAPASGSLKDAFFAFDASVLTPEDRAALDADAKRLRANPKTDITLEGHCDERGTVEYNQALGERRADAARDYLVASGIDASRIHVISYGKERPFDPGHDEAAWAKNRRAHVVVD